MTPEERRKIYINNLSKVKNRTGRPKKNAKQFLKNNLPAYAKSIIQDEQIFKKVSQYMADHNISFDFAINRIVSQFLKVKNPMELSQYIKYGCPEDEICKQLFVSSEVVRTAKERMERMEVLNLDDSEFKTFCKTIDKLTKF